MSVTTRFGLNRGQTSATPVAPSDTGLPETASTVALDGWDAASTHQLSPATEGEKVIVRIRPNARSLILPSLGVVLICGITGYFAGRLPEEWMNNAVLITALVLIIVAWGLPILAWLSHHYTFTSRRVIMRRGLFTRYRQELDLAKAGDVTLRRRGLQVLARSADVLVVTGKGTRVVLHDLPHPELVTRMLGELIDEELRASHGAWNYSPDKRVASSGFYPSSPPAPQI